MLSDISVHLVLLIDDNLRYVEVVTMPAALEITGMTTTNQPMLDTHSQQVSNFANNDSDMSGMTMNNNNNDSSIMTSPNGPMLRAQYGPPAPPKAAPVDIPAYTMSHADISAQLKIYRSNTTLLNPSRYLNRLIRRPGYFGPLMLWWVRDWGGLICSVFTWFLVVFGEVTFTVLILASQDPISAVLHGLFNYTCAWLGIIAHLRAMFTDPVSRECIQFFYYFALPMYFPFYFSHLLKENAAYF